VHNIGFALADLGKKVLLIDADPQMNLTSAMYGLSTSVEYSMEDGAKWRKYTEEYISFSEHLNKYLRDEICHKRMFEAKSPRSKDGLICLISGSIQLSMLEADLYNVITSKINLYDRFIINFEKSIRDCADDYDFILIDTCPSASSIINALSVMTADYFIAPVTPTFFSLQAIDNMSQIITNWNKLLRDYQQIPNKTGISLKTKFLGLVVQMAKTYKGYSSATNEWSNQVNDSAKRFVDAISKYEYVISESEFKKLFQGRKPYIIKDCCDFTGKLRGIAENNGVPVIHLTPDMCNKKNASIVSGTYKKPFDEINQNYREIAESLTKLL
jgi:cellulose biosynthesis protein BcsQ